MNMKLISAIVAAMLAGCAKEKIIVAMPITVPPPPAEVMAPKQAVACAKRPKDGTFKVSELEKINECHQRDRDVAHAQLAGLQQSVRTRWMEMDHMKKKADSEISGKGK